MTLPTDDYIRELETELAVARKRKAMEEENAQLRSQSEQLLVEQQHAEAAAAMAKRQLSEFEKQIDQARREIEHLAEQKSNLVDEGTVRARSQLAVVQKELETARIARTEQKKHMDREINDRNAAIEQLNKKIATALENLRDLEGGAKRIEANAIAQNEKINADKQALERDVSNLQERKLTLGHEARTLEAKIKANREEIDKLEQELEQAREQAATAKRENAAMQAQLEAKRTELTEISRAFNAVKEEKGKIEKDRDALVAQRVKLKGEIKKIERQARA